VWLVHLHGDRDVLADRLRARTGHFMKVSMLDSQLADLEPRKPDEPGITLDLAEPPATLDDKALAEYAGAYPQA
jgi:gluconokinase